MTVLAERILFLARAAVELRQRGDRGPAQPLRGVGRIDEAHVVRGHADRQRALMTGDRRALFLGDFNDSLELLEAANPIPVLPAPVVPLGGLHAGEVTTTE